MLQSATGYDSNRVTHFDTGGFCIDLVRGDTTDLPVTELGSPEAGQLAILAYGLDNESSCDRINSKLIDRR